MIDFSAIPWTTEAWCWRCQRVVLIDKREAKGKVHNFCSVCGIPFVHGPRTAFIAPEGRTFLAFDADALHYRIAACLSGDRFIGDTLARYDLTGDVRYKPHIVNCSALFGVDVAEAIDYMHQEHARYTFAKNFIYMLLNGGDVPALANAAAMTGLALSEREVGKLLRNWLDQAKEFERWRSKLIDEAIRTGSITLADGRRRRFYSLRQRNGEWIVDTETKKEIYNFPLIGTEVSYVNPRIRQVWESTMGGPWIMVLHSHDGFMLEGPEGEEEAKAKELIPILKEEWKIGDKVLNVPWSTKKGGNWACLQ